MGQPLGWFSNFLLQLGLHRAVALTVAISVVASDVVSAVVMLALQRPRAAFLEGLTIGTLVPLVVAPAIAHAAFRLLYERAAAVNALERALAEVRTLGELLPICSACKCVRDDDGYWHQIEEFVSQRTDTLFSHGLCPECLERLYPQMAADLRARAAAKTSAGGGSSGGA